jgi:hypothetical protein
VGELLLQQADLTAKKQVVSKRLQVLVGDGRQLAAFLRAGVKQQYGTRSEKLSAFNLQPFRGRKAAKAEKAAKNFRFWYEGLSPEERVNAVQDCLLSALKAKGIREIPRLRRAHRVLELRRGSI